MKQREQMASILTSLSCSRRSNLELALELVGSNRVELKVLKHYATHLIDSLKLRATKFLIVNMPGKYSMYYNAPWNDVATIGKCYGQLFVQRQFRKPFVIIANVKIASYLC